jgi:cytochrome oxidase assembly protein ShyY1
VYRFLLTPRWIGAAVITVAASVVMVFLGNWQLHRYQERSAINARIDAADSTPAVPLTSLLAKPGATTPGATTPGAAGSPGAAGTPDSSGAAGTPGSLGAAGTPDSAGGAGTPGSLGAAGTPDSSGAAGTLGEMPGKDVAWTKVTVTGRYDADHEVQARGRTVNSKVGYEILTPLVLPDGTAVLVDRGWVPYAGDDANSAPVSSPPPTGDVTVVGQVHLSESRGTEVTTRDGRLDTRRVSLPRLSEKLPYPLYGAYVLVSEPAQGFTKISIDHEDSWQNAGYAIQWWLFSALALIMYGWQARKEAHGDRPKKRIDRVAAADDRLPARDPSTT